MTPPVTPIQSSEYDRTEDEDFDERRQPLDSADELVSIFISFESQSVEANIEIDFMCFVIQLSVCSREKRYVGKFQEKSCWCWYHHSNLLEKRQRIHGITYVNFSALCIRRFYSSYY